MTKHRKPDDWIADILEAAAAIVDELGHDNLTMDAVASRTGLSKGGVYRFFPSKRELVLALLDRAYFHAMDFDIDEAVAWNLPIDETFVRVVVDNPTVDAARTERDDRIWLQIMPQALWDPDLAERYRTVTARFEHKCLELAKRLLARDGITVDRASLLAIQDAVQMGLILRDGLAVRASVIASVNESAEVGRRYVRLNIRQILGGSDA